ncbi:hypothetical protein ACWPOB_25210 [Rhodococcus sp. 2H158]|nr:hypothetical protein GQ85_00830 [Rhodococcus rhodochrous]
MSNMAVEKALETIRPSLGADGYILKVGESMPDSIEVVLEALPDACSDCLVPDAVLLQILQVAIKDNGDNRSVRLSKVGFDGAESH